MGIKWSKERVKELNFAWKKLRKKKSAAKIPKAKINWNAKDRKEYALSFKKSEKKAIEAQRSETESIRRIREIKLTDR